MLEQSYGAGGTILSWFSTCLKQWLQYAFCKSSTFTALPLLCMVPQWSILGSLLFLLYMMVHPLLYADDRQVYGFCSMCALAGHIASGIGDVSTWISPTECSQHSSCGMLHVDNCTGFRPLLGNNYVIPISCFCHSDTSCLVAATYCNRLEAYKVHWADEFFCHL